MDFHLPFCSITHDHDCALLVHLINLTFTEAGSYMSEFGQPDSLYWPSKTAYDPKMSRRKYVRLKAGYR